MIGSNPEARIAVIGTGGTIAGRNLADRDGYRSAETGIAGVLDHLRPWLGLGADTVLEASDATTIPGQAHTPESWVQTIGAVRAAVARPGTTGIVVTTGTDTLEEFAYLLRLTVASAVPLVVTGAMYPLDTPGGDAAENLAAAISYAADPRAPAGVVVLLDRTVFPARGVTKVRTSGRGAFDAPHAGRLATLDGSDLRLAADRRHGTGSAFATGLLDAFPPVDILYGYAGNNAHLALAAADAGAAGIVVAGVGNGNLHPELEATLAALSRGRGIVIVRATRVFGGVVSSGGEHPEYDPFIPAGDLSPAQARVLLVLALSRFGDARGVRAAFREY